MKKFFALAALCCAWVSAAWALPYTTDDLKSLVASNPKLADNQSAIVLHRDEAWGRDAGGFAFRQGAYVVLAGSQMPTDWLNGDLVVPDGGDLELEQAAWAQADGSGLTSLTYQEGDDIVAVDWPKWQGEPRLLVLRFRQYFPAGKPVGGAFNLRMQYPVIEESLRVRLDQGDNLFFYSSDNREPVVREEGDTLWYAWFKNNQPVKGLGGGLVASADGFVVFSLEPGTGDAQITMEKLAAYENKQSLLRSKPGDPMTQVFAELNRLAETAPSTGEGLYRNLKLLDHGTATNWERAVRLNAALKQAGFSTRLWFQSYVPMHNEMPNTAFTLHGPVIEVIEKGDKGWFYIPGATGDQSVPDELKGRTLYEQRGEKLIERAFSAGKVSDNRLTARWNLKATLDGLVEGTVTITAKGGWPKALPGQKLDGATLPSLSTWINGPAEISEEKGELTVTYPVKGFTGVGAEQGIMYRLPSLRVGLLENLKQYQGEVLLTFPFVLEQFYTVDLPEGYAPLSLPNSGQAGSDRITYSAHQRHNRLKNQLEAEEKLVVRPTTITASESADFLGLLAAWGLWERNGLPLVK